MAYGGAEPTCRIDSCFDSCFGAILLASPGNHRYRPFEGLEANRPRWPNLSSSALNFEDVDGGSAGIKEYTS